MWHFCGSLGEYWNEDWQTDMTIGLNNHDNGGSNQEQ